MSLKHLTLPPDVEKEEERFLKKLLTPFEQKRAAAVTYAELVELAYEENMEFPEGWAEHVLNARNRLF